METLYSTAEAAEILRIALRTVSLWIRTGKLRAVKVGKNWRIPESALEEMAAGEIHTPKNHKLAPAAMRKKRVSAGKFSLDMSFEDLPAESVAGCLEDVARRLRTGDREGEIVSGGEVVGKFSMK
mgnify:FL=1